MDLNIPPLDRSLAGALQARLDSRTKPPGSLGQLEAIALQAGLVFNTTTPQLRAPRVVVFAGDHGAALEGVSAFPQAVTQQMVMNFLRGGAAINVLARQAALAMTVVDAGVVGDFPAPPRGSDVEWVAAKIAPGTDNFIERAAMSRSQCIAAVVRGAGLVRGWHAAGCNAIAFGEMGIGNTASASLLTQAITGVPLADVVGRGTGLDDAGLARKRALLARAQARVAGRQMVPLDLLAEFGGYEIAMMVGGFIAAAQSRMLVVVDGFIVTAALLVAHALSPNVRDYCVFAHRSGEAGHIVQLRHLGAPVLLDAGMRLGEGSGAALAFPIVRAALALMNDMAGFADAGISEQAR